MESLMFFRCLYVTKLLLTKIPVFLSMRKFLVGSHDPLQLTTVTPSLRRDSPNTRIKRTSSTWISSNTAKTATGSTAEINDENKKMWRTGNSSTDLDFTNFTATESPLSLDAAFNFTDNATRVNNVEGTWTFSFAASN